MSEFNKFHTIHIEIPREMLYETPSGIIKLVPSLTKTGNLSKRNKHASIIIEKTDNLKPSIKYEGVKAQLVKKGPQAKKAKAEAKEEPKPEPKPIEVIKKKFNVIKKEESESESESDEEPEPPKPKSKEATKYENYMNKEQKYMGIINKLREKDAITTAKKNDLLGYLEDEDYKKLDKALEKYGVKTTGAGRLPDDVQKFLETVFKRKL